VMRSARRLAKDLVIVGKRRARRARAGVARGARAAARTVQSAAHGAGHVTASALESVADRVES
jgi:hypothetical protein